MLRLNPLNPDRTTKTMSPDMGVHCFLGVIVLNAERCWRVLRGWTTYPSMPERVGGNRREGRALEDVNGEGALAPFPHPSL